LQPVFESSSLPALPLPPLKPVAGLDARGRYSLAPSIRDENRAVWPVFAVFVSAMAATIGASFFAIAAFVAAGHGQTTNNTELQAGVQQMLADPLGILTLMAAAQVAFLIVALAAAAVSPLGIKRRLSLGQSRIPIWGYLFLPLGMFAISMLFNALLRVLHVELGGSLQMLDTTFTQMSGRQVIIAVVIIGGMPGVAEEFLFRGYIQTRLTARWGAALSIFVTALLFGAAHFDRFQSPATFIMGLYLGLIAYRAGSIRPSMWCHAINNGGSVLLTWLAGQHAGGDVTEQGSVAMQAGIGGGVLLMCVLILLLITRRPRKTQLALT